MDSGALQRHCIFSSDEWDVQPPGRRSERHFNFREVSAGLLHKHIEETKRHKSTVQTDRHLLLIYSIWKGNDPQKKFVEKFDCVFVNSVNSLCNMYVGNCKYTLTWILSYMNSNIKWQLSSLFWYICWLELLALNMFVLVIVLEETRPGPLLFYSCQTEENS